MQIAEIWKIVRFIIENLIWLKPLIENKMTKDKELIMFSPDLVKIYGYEIESIAKMLEHLSENELREILTRAAERIKTEKITLSEFLTLQAVKKLLKLS
jgi:hypothetical protein